MAMETLKGREGRLGGCGSTEERGAGTAGSGDGYRKAAMEA